MNKRFYFGIQNKISDNKYLFFCDCDISLTDETIKKLCDYFKNANLLIYKTLNGSHIVSLNFYKRKYVECLYDYVHNVLDVMDRDYYKFARMNNFITTLRINKKPHEEKRLLAWQYGLYSNKIHKQYYELFKVMLPEIPSLPIEMLEPSLTSFIGYIWDLDLSKKWTFEKLCR